MLVYNVEVFDQNFTCVYHDQVSEIRYVEDYIDKTKNTVSCRLDEVVKEGYLISIASNKEKYLGIVSSTDLNKAQMEISYYPFYTLFDTQILFDTTLQGSGRSLESVIKDYIEEYFVNNTDTVQNVPVIGHINLLSSTTTWGFNLKSDKEGMNKCIINFYNVILKRAFNKYAIMVDCVPNFSTGKVDINIGVRHEATYTFETKLPSVISASVLVGKLESDVNKLVVYDDSDYTSTRIYYLHPDLSYDMIDTDRIFPVAEELESVSVPQDSTFPDVADSAAADVFGGLGFNNNIELEMLPNEFSMVKIGQMANIIHNGVTYTSILSKKEYDKTCKLTFGCVRVSLTYLLKKGAL